MDRREAIVSDKKKKLKNKKKSTYTSSKQNHSSRLLTKRLQNTHVQLTHRYTVVPHKQNNSRAVVTRLLANAPLTKTKQKKKIRNVMTAENAYTFRPSPDS